LRPQGKCASGAFFARFFKTAFVVVERNREFNEGVFAGLDCGGICLHHGKAGFAIIERRALIKP